MLELQVCSTDLSLHIFIILVWFAFRLKYTCMFIHPLPSQLSGSAVCTATSLASCPSILYGGSLWGPFSLLLYMDLELDPFSVGEHWLVSSQYYTVALCSCYLMLCLEVWSYWNKGYVGICTKYGWTPLLDLWLLHCRCSEWDLVYTRLKVRLFVFSAVCSLIDGKWHLTDIWPKSSL